MATKQRHGNGADASNPTHANSSFIPNDIASCIFSSSKALKSFAFLTLECDLKRIKGGAVFNFLLAPANLPFAVALLLMVMIGLVEAVGLGLGAIDIDADVDGGGDLLGWLGWLGVGQIPLLMVLVVFLALFGMIGIFAQGIANALLGGPLSPWIAGPIAIVAALPLTGLCSRLLARILPRDETTAVGLESLIGRRATVTVGTARQGSPARASVRDVHGQVHYVMIEPSDETQSVPEGGTLLLVRREGGTFIGLYEGEPLLGPAERPALGRF